MNHHVAVILSEFIGELVVEALKPHKSGHLMSGSGVIGRVVFLEVLEHLADRFIHHPPVEAGILADVLGVLRLLLFVVQCVGPGGGWAKIIIDGLASPGRLDQEDRAIQFLCHGEAEAEFRSDLGGVPPEAHRQWSRAFVAVCNRGDVNPVGDDAG